MKETAIKTRTLYIYFQTIPFNDSGQEKRKIHISPKSSNIFLKIYKLYLSRVQHIAKRTHQSSCF